MSALIFAFPGQDDLLNGLLDKNNPLTAAGWQRGDMELRHFPDGETYVRVLSEVQDRNVVILCQLHQPNAKLVALLLLADTLSDLGARRVGLVAPYLAYMRQDKRFNAGEGITSHYIARLLGQHIDWLVTVDPHLHRISRLDEVYAVPAVSLTATQPIADWIRSNVERPLIIGPDSESAQWAASVAELIGCPCEVLQKERLGDRSVKISLPHVDKYLNHTPVLVDDIISTGKTMIQAAGHLREAGLASPVCVAVHGVFADGAAAEMAASGLTVISCNSIADPSNRIDLAPLLSAALIENFNA